MSDVPRRHYRPMRDCLRLWRSLWRAVWMHPTWFILAFLALLACAVFSAHWVGSPSFIHEHRVSASDICGECSDKVVSDRIATPDDHSYSALLKKPSLGVTFTFILSLITVSGFLIAITKLEQLLGQVTSLRTFLERGTEIIQNATERGDPVWVICHSPFIGNLSIRGTKPQITFREALKTAVKDPKVSVQIIGLSPARLREYYESFSTDGRLERAEVDEALKEMEDLLIKLQGDGMKNVYHCMEKPPTIFLVASEYEAVVASALFVPPSEPIIDRSVTGKEDPAKKESSALGKKVEMIGFATREGSTIESLFEAFQFTLRDSRTLNDAQEVIAAIRNGVFAEKA